MQKEIYARGPIACGIDASPILKYTSGIATDAGEGVDHVISVVGWGTDEKEGKYCEFRAKRGITLIARGMTLTRLCSHAPVAALLPARVGQHYWDVRVAAE